MILDFCCICGKKEDLNQHHVIPVVKGGINDETNLITLCYKHHMWIHGRKYRDSINHSMLIKEGQMKSVRLAGRPTNLTDNIKLKVMELKQNGIGIKKIAKECSIGIQTVYKVLKES